jgi:hypothetical protein
VSQQVVVEAYLKAEAPLPPIRLTRTVGAGETFDPRAAAVEGAEVEVRILDGSGDIAATTAYSEGETPGVYTPVPTAPDTVRTTGTYQLHVKTDDGRTVTSTTTVPGPIRLRTAENTTAEYQNDAQQPALTIVPPQLPTGTPQNVYTFTVTSLLPKDSLLAHFTPFYRDQYDADEDSLESFRTTSSGLLNQGNFSENADGTITVDLPWLGIAFFGPNEVALNVVDENFYDFQRSAEAQQGAFAPGEIPNVIEHIEGGTGIFGSYAQEVVRVEIVCPAQPPARRARPVGSGPGR